MGNEWDYVELGLGCAYTCKTLGQGVEGKALDDLSQFVCDSMPQLTTWVGPVIRSLGNSPMVLSITESW